MSKEVVAASWCPSDGHANPLKATLGFYRKALQLGVTFITGVTVSALEKVKGRIRRVITDDGVYEADQILLCAGYESRKIANTVGIDAPVERQFNEVLVTEAQPKMFDIMLGVAVNSTATSQNTVPSSWAATAACRRSPPTMTTSSPTA